MNELVEAAKKGYADYALVSKAIPSPYIRSTYPRLVEVVERIDDKYNIDGLYANLEERADSLRKIPNMEKVLDIVLSLYYGTLDSNLYIEEIETALRVVLYSVFGVKATCFYTVGDTDVVNVVVGDIPITIKSDANHLDARLMLTMLNTSFVIPFFKVAGVSAAPAIVQDELNGILIGLNNNMDAYWQQCEAFWIDESFKQVWRPTNVIERVATFSITLYKKGANYLAYVTSRNEETSYYIFKGGLTEKDIVNLCKQFVAKNISTDMFGWKVNPIAISSDAKNTLSLALCVNGENYRYTPISLAGGEFIVEHITRFIFEECWFTKLVYLNPKVDKYQFVICSPDMDTDVILAEVTPDARAGSVYEVQEVIADICAKAVVM